MLLHFSVCKLGILLFNRMYNISVENYGCGVIAHQLADAMQQEGRTLYGVANRTYSKAKDFAEKYHIPKVYENIQDIFTDENVDIIYISTPHNTPHPKVTQL